MIVNKDWKPNFYKYEKVRRSGRYNMIMEADKAIKACGVSSREYRDIILSYSTYKRYTEAEYGAVATSIFEWWGECWDYAEMSPQTAKLLLAAILDNTLNFNAEITTRRDHHAAEKLAQIAGTTVEEFVNWYFSEVSKTINADVQNSLLLDHKTVSIPGQKEHLTFTQITIWDAEDIFTHGAQITEIMDSITPDWVVSISALHERKNYMLASSTKWKQYFMNLLKANKFNHWLVTDHMLLRKEIIKRMLDSNS